jgi:hypothetical protein
MRKLIWGLAAALVCTLLAVPAANFYYKSSRGQGCARCHEIQANFNSWRSSAHRQLNCTECHDSSTMANVRRVSTHASGEVPEPIHLPSRDVIRMVERCRVCHRQEFAEWSSGGHAANYARIFTSAEHNHKRLLIDDCLRCHGMHIEGSIGTVVQPLDTKGPWKIGDAALANAPAIPCLACHAMHREGRPLAKPEQRTGKSEEIARPSLGLFDRRSQMNIAMAVLPLPAIFEGERKVRISPDQRQALCYQCHAPLAAAQAGSGDDRTPLGVHEGLSCLACHQPHSQNTRPSCANCHPRLSNCGIDVERMDTTFADPKSGHNVHTVRCIDCHTNGVPRRPRSF